jgi:hypothetical protein
LDCGANLTAGGQSPPGTVQMDDSEIPIADAETVTGAGRRETRDGDRLASQGTDPQDEPRKSTVGQPTGK